MNDNDIMIFADEEPDTKTGYAIQQDKIIEDIPWKVLIVDDDEEIHIITRMVLKNYYFENRPLLLLSAYSGEEATKVLTQEENISLILLDVVMETDDAGLQCVKNIREELKNHQVRIILRTGQPGQAPEKEVIIKYDINDYKSKTELTSLKLFTVVTASLRSYKYIKTIEHNRIGLENIIMASRSLFYHKSFNYFATEILRQITSILQINNDSLYITCQNYPEFKKNCDQDYYILAGTGKFAGKENCLVKNIVSKNIYTDIVNVKDTHESIFSSDSYIGYFETHRGEQAIVYLKWESCLTDMDRDLIAIFSTNIAIAFDNISLNNEILSTQKEVIFTLSEVLEGRSKETANHLRRVAEVASMIAKKMGLNDNKVEMIRLAAPMHDIGKVATPDSILTKPGKLTSKEYEIVKKHAALGYTIFKNSTSEIMKTAAIIAHQHHEKWNGEGYPQGMKGTDIHLYGRITALADVVDALHSKRCYKDAWDIDKVIKTLKEERGKHFDPEVVDVFLNSIKEYKEIVKKWL